MSDVEAGYLEWRSKHYAELVSGVAGRLRSMADEVEREGRLRAERVVGVLPHAWSAHSVVNTVTWGVADVNLDGLVIAASEADDLFVEREQ